MQGKAWKFKNNVDTDLIIPARYLNTHDPAELARHCMEDADPGFSKKVKKGDFIVAGENFGCGSSREHAPVAIKAAGVSAVIAGSFARIFFRNAINIGLPIIELKQADEIKEGDTLEVDVEKGQIKDLDSGKTFKAGPFSPFMKNIIDKGGLISHVKEKL
ncbi:MAG: 3-isopropylmalate dehydratase small subunit [Candidatus Saganbacteria bacterium]|nr:3-isopropylmalate dehydratase small subunit [Candidatus Saganbacteria bacterium]